MPKYRIKQEVPWRTILKILHCHLIIKERLYKRIPYKGNLCDLRESYESYRDLRKFLGYMVPTKQEKAIEKLLNE